MKKLFYFAAAAVALAACAKNEVIPVNSGENQEITFNVAPKTKGTVSSTDPRYFNELNHFVSYAYFRKDGNEWPGAEGEIYINAAEISFDANKWKAASTYYWPKSEKSSLTFFAWSTNSASITLTDATVSCDSKSGISVSGYDVIKNKNVDLLVADVAAKKTANEDLYSHNGVPTLFRHKLSYLIFNVKTAADYKTKDGKDFFINSITLRGFDSKGSYSQKADNKTSTDPSPIVYDKTGVWSDFEGKNAAGATTPSEQKYFNSTGGVEFGKDVMSLDANAGVDQKYYLPQTIADIEDPSSTTNYTIEVVYTIKTTEKSTVTTETVKKYIKASDIYGENWEINKKYTCTLTFSLNEIHWDPAVEEWTPGTVSSDVK